MKIRSAHIKIVVVTVCCLLLFFQAYNQTNGGRNNNWITNNTATSVMHFNFNGLNFSSGVPVLNVSFNMNIFSMSDKSGNLLYYSDGLTTIYNRNHQIMQNGNIPSSIRAIPTTFACKTVPAPCHDSLYYVFWVGESNRLRYTLINMNLDNGLGGVIPGQKGVVVPGSDSLSPYIDITKHGNNRDFWIMTRAATGNTWKAFLLTPLRYYAESPSKSNRTGY